MFSREDMKPDMMDKIRYIEKEEKNLKEAKDNMIVPNTRYYRKGKDAGKGPEAARRSKRLRALKEIGSKVWYGGMETHRTLGILEWYKNSADAGFCGKTKK